MTPFDPEFQPRPPRPGPQTPAPGAAWQRLAAGARIVRRERDSVRDSAAPFGFAARVVARWREIREQESRLALWQRISWRAAVASLALTAVVVFMQRGLWTAAERPLLEPPVITFPGI